MFERTAKCTGCESEADGIVLGDLSKIQNKRLQVFADTLNSTFVTAYVKTRTEFIHKIMTLVSNKDFDTAIKVVNRVIEPSFTTIKKNCGCRNPCRTICQTTVNLPNKINKYVFYEKDQAGKHRVRP